MAAVCDWQVNPPRQRRIGRAAEQSDGAFPSGSVAYLDFSRNVYLIEGRVYTNPALTVSVNWAGRTVYMSHADGIDIRGGRARLNLPPGSYDILQIDPEGGYWRDGVTVPYDASIVPRVGTSFVQAVLVFPAGTLSPEEKEALIVVANVQADWDENDSGSSSHIRNKPNVVTQVELEARVIAEVAEATSDVIKPVISFREAPGGEAIEYQTDAFPGIWYEFVGYDLIRGDPAPAPIAWQSGMTATVNASYAFDNAVWRALTATTTDPIEGADWEKLYDGAAITHDHDDRYPLIADVYTKTAADATFEPIGGGAPSSLGKHSIWVPAIAMFPSTASGATPELIEFGTVNDYVPSHQVLAFDAATTETAFFNVDMPKSWDGGDLYIYILWNTSATTGDVVWTVRQFSPALADGDDINKIAHAASSITDTAKGTAGRLARTNIGTLSMITSSAAQRFLPFTIHRKATLVNDTLAVDANLIGVTILYTTNAATDD